MKDATKGYGTYQGEKRVRREQYWHSEKGEGKCCVCGGKPKGMRWWFVWVSNNGDETPLCSSKCVDEFYQEEGWEDEREAQVEQMGEAMGVL